MDKHLELLTGIVIMVCGGLIANAIVTTWLV